VNWFGAERQRFIGEMLAIYGFIRRVHIMRKFDVTHAVATGDIRGYIAAHPAQPIGYDKRRRAYIDINIIPDPKDLLIAIPLPGEPAEEHE
jgi:hypothetical protein